MLSLHCTWTAITVCHTVGRMQVNRWSRLSYTLLLRLHNSWSKENVLKLQITISRCPLRGSTLIWTPACGGSKNFKKLKFIVVIKILFCLSQFLYKLIEINNFYKVSRSRPYRRALRRLPTFLIYRRYSFLLDIPS